MTGMKSFLRLIVTIVCLGAVCAMYAQDFNQITDDGTILTKQQTRSDSVQSKHKEIHRGIRVWTVDERFGDRTPAIPDTVSYMYMNTVFTSGLRGEYNFTGNMAGPRQNRIFINRRGDDVYGPAQAFSYFMHPVSEFHFTNTYTPITNLTYTSCGGSTTGEDRLKASFAVNAGRKLGVGFIFDYMYGRGYYQENASALFNYTMFGSYVGDRYEAHLLTTLNHMKQAENGGITNDNYITHPESFAEEYQENEIPTMLEKNWNRNDNQHIFFSHRYNVGFNRQVPMTEEEKEAKRFAMAAAKEKEAEEAREKARKEAVKQGLEFDEEEYEQQRKQQLALGRQDSTALKNAADTTWTKNEYVPVTSFIHTLKWDFYKRTYQAYYVPENYYANEYYTAGKYQGDSIYDKSHYYELKNTFAVAMMEGFNKWAKAGLKLYGTHIIRHYALPNETATTDSYNEHGILIGAQLIKTQGQTLHYCLNGELGVVGYDAGSFSLNGTADLNFHLLGDTVQLAAEGFFNHQKPSLWLNNFHARHFWWDNESMSYINHLRAGGTLSLKRTGTSLKVMVDNITNYTYYATSYEVNSDYLRNYNTATVRQFDGSVQVFTAQLSQAFAFGPLHLDAMVTYQKSSEEDVLPLPDLNVYANLFLRFRIAKVLDCDFGSDVRWFTKYYAPDYVPGIAQFAVQENKESRTEIGNYPVVNVYANFKLKQARFFAMLSHVNASHGNYFFTPHYPLAQMVFRFGVSWNFFN